MSYPLPQDGVVIIQNGSLRKGDRIIARFGNAELFVDALGRTELRGGSKEDLLQAREWISIFYHEASPSINRMSVKKLLPRF